jgi:DNA-binding NtrC family response regulator
MSSDQETRTAAESAAAPGKDGGRLVTFWIHPVWRVTELTPRRLSLGRAEDSDVLLDGPETSRRHAVIEFTAGRHQVYDLQSRNGLFVNGVRVTSSALNRGDVLKIGGWVGVVSDAVAFERSRALRELAPGLLAGPAFAQVLLAAQKAAQSSLPLVIHGETGTGKEQVARAVHGWSGRPGEFVGVNCAAIPESLAEAEFFGFRKGAFTGAQRDSVGLFRAADGGTLFLDEVTDLPLNLQAKLLRVLEERAVMPVGATRALPVDVRVLAATQVPLAEAVRRGTFRPDLQARLEGMTLDLPPLRERRADIVPLFLAILERLGVRPVPSLSAAAAERLCLYSWPLNVRELMLLCRNLATVQAAAPIRLESLPDRIRFNPVESAPQASDLSLSGRPLVPTLALSLPASGPLPAPGHEVFETEDEEWDALQRALLAAKGNLTRAAATLGLSRQRAYRLIAARNPSALVDARAKRRRRTVSTP